MNVHTKDILLKNGHAVESMYSANRGDVFPNQTLHNFMLLVQTSKH